MVKACFGATKSTQLLQHASRRKQGSRLLSKSKRSRVARRRYRRGIGGARRACRFNKDAFIFETRRACSRREDPLTGATRKLAWGCVLLFFFSPPLSANARAQGCSASLASEPTSCPGCSRRGSGEQRELSLRGLEVGVGPIYTTARPGAKGAFQNWAREHQANTRQRACTFLPITSSSHIKITSY